VKSHYILAPEAALDLVEIWRHIKGKAGSEIADKAEVVDPRQASFSGCKSRRCLQAAAILHGSLECRTALERPFVKG